jgi:hypothetical protein
MAAEAEAERDRRARITHAQGELQAAARTRLASDILGHEGYKLRTLQTLDEVARENATIVTIPAELISEGTHAEGTSGKTAEIIDKIRDSIDINEMIGKVRHTLEEEDGTDDISLSESEKA